jgi:hypothetical protein
MEINPIPTEQTTAVTDALMGLLSLVIALYLYRLRGGRESFKVNVWLSAFGLLTIASFTGVVAHGLKLPEAVYVALRQPLNIALGLTIALFVVGVMCDVWGPAVARRWLPWLIGTALVFYGITVIFTGTFLVFIAYEAIAMLFALAVCRREKSKCV